MEPDPLESREQRSVVDTSWTQFALEGLIFAGIAVLLFMTAERLPAQRVDGHVVLAIAVALHAAGLVRLVLRAADFAEQDLADQD